MRHHFRFILCAVITLAAPAANAQQEATAREPDVAASFQECQVSIGQDADSLSALVLNFLASAGEESSCTSIPDDALPSGDVAGIRSTIGKLAAPAGLDDGQGCKPGEPLCAQWEPTAALKSRLVAALEPQQAARYLLGPKTLDAFGEPEQIAPASPPDVVGEAGFGLDAPEGIGEVLLSAVESGCEPLAHSKLEDLYKSSGDAGPQVDRIEAELGSVPAGSACVTALQQAGSIVLVRAYLQEAHARTLGQAAFQALATRAQSNYERWDAYNFGGGTSRVQLPWELALNGWLYERQVQDKKDPWPEPPKSAITVVHPVAGLAPYDINGLKSGVIGAVEIVGYSRWNYSAENTREDEWGASIAAVYAERESGPSWHPGAVVRTPFMGASIVYARLQGVKAGEDSDLFAISVDVSTLFSSGGLTKQLACQFDLPVCKGS